MKFKKRILFALIIAITFSCSTDKNIDISKYPMVTTVNELANYYLLNVDTTGKYEMSKTTKYFDGSFDIEYTYDLTQTEDYDPLYYSIVIEKGPTVKDAREMYLIGRGALSLVSSTMGLKMIEIDSLDLPGDDSFYALQTYDDEPVGIHYTVRKGKCIYTLTTSGIYFPDHSMIYDLVLPKIEDLESFNLIN